MNTNALLTYLLYALLAGLIIVAGYKTCQMRQDKANMAREQEELQQNLRDLGYLEEDTAGTRFNDQPEPATSSPAPSGSAKSAPAVSADGIEDDYASPAPVNTQPKSTKPAPAPKPAPAAAKPEPLVEESPRTAGDGRYRVVAGSFTVLDGARREMERLIKMGYHDAEVGRYNRGKYAVVIVKRTNDLNEANRIAEQLQRKGIDASVIDRERK